MKSMIVIEMDLNCEKRKRKAIRVVSKTQGSIDTCSVEGRKLVVVGNDLDAALLVTKLRKKVGSAHIVRVETVKSTYNEGGNYGYYPSYSLISPVPYQPPQVILMPSEPSYCNIM